MFYGANVWLCFCNGVTAWCRYNERKSPGNLKSPGFRRSVYLYRKGYSSANVLEIEEAILELLLRLTLRILSAFSRFMQVK